MKNFYKGFTVLLQLEPEPNWKSRSRPKKGSFPPHTRDAKHNPRLWDRDARTLFWAYYIRGHFGS